jgi:photosystem II stability/assembly factor-like uncharacterized protein
MRYILIIGLSIFFFYSCNFQQEKTKTSKIVSNPSLTIFDIKSSIRALEAINENSCWFAGSGGLVGFTKDGGESWQFDSIVFEGIKPEFRSIAVFDSVVYVLSVASPALLFKSTDWGKSWELVYRDDDPKTFYNSMAFYNVNSGYAVGDPVEGCLSVVVTKNGGEHWRKIPCILLPETSEGEAGFAASNTSIELFGDNIWLVSGGKAARVFHSKNRGQSWEVYETPIIQGEAMTGIFSVDFYNDTLGIIWGGDWENQSGNKKNKALTTDGGKTWKLISDGEYPGYRSCVQFVPNSDGLEIFAVGMPGISYSSDQGKSWTNLNDEGFYTIRIPEKGNMAWLAGKNKIGKITW